MTKEFLQSIKIIYKIIRFVLLIGIMFPIVFTWAFIKMIIFGKPFEQTFLKWVAWMDRKR